MCFAIPAAVQTALTIMSAASAAAGVVMQRQAASAQERLLTQQRAAQAEEIAAQRDRAIGERVAAARREAAMRLVSAADAGVGGMSALQGIQQAFGSANQDAAVVAKQAMFSDRASQAIYASEMARVEKPSLIDAGLQIAGSVAKASQKIYDLKRRRKATLDKLTIR